MQTFDGRRWVERVAPGTFGLGVLAFLTVPPTLSCEAGPAVQELECDGGPVELTLAGAVSPVPSILGLTVTASWSGDFVEGTATGLTPTVHFVGLGDHVATLTVRAGDASSTCSTTVRIVDTTPPVFSGRTQCLWPPDHRYRCFDVADLVASGSARAVDSCDGIVQVHVESAWSSQYEDGSGVGDGSTGDDILFDATQVCVRQERQGVDWVGRDYTVLLVATDASGNVTHETAVIHVPHDMRPDRRCDFHPVNPGLLPHAPLPLDPGRQEGTYPVGPPRRIHR